MKKTITILNRIFAFGLIVKALWLFFILKLYCSLFQKIASRVRRGYGFSYHIWDKINENRLEGITSTN